MKRKEDEKKLCLLGKTFEIFSGFFGLWLQYYEDIFVE
jgi:hypothetical protein